MTLTERCQHVLSGVELDHLWTDAGPTTLAIHLLEHGSTLSGGERLLLKVAWDLWNGAGNALVYELIQFLDTPNLVRVGEAIVGKTTKDRTLDEVLDTAKEVLG